MFGKITREKEIIKLVDNAIDKCIEQGLLEIKKEDVPQIRVEVPREEKFGDFSVNTAMQLAKAARCNPRIIAENIIKNIDTKNSYVKDISIAGAGFINFTLDNKWLYDELKKVINLKDKYGKIIEENPKKVNVEYVSANPTGPLHIGNARGGAIGDVISNILTWAGCEVTKEFYLNDAGNQIIKFGESLESRYLQELGKDVTFPEDGYKGEDITELAKSYIEENGDKLLNVSEEERQHDLVEYSLDKNVSNMVNDLKDYGIDYDVFFSERTLHNSGAIDDVISKMKNDGSVYKKEGALWFKGTEYGLEKDEVLIRQNGVPTYYAADIAYHYDKLVKRNFDYAINVWGADHHGHVARLKKAMVALGVNEDRLDVILMQLVHLVKNNEALRMSKRKGNIYTLSDLVGEVGKDAARFVFNYNKPNTHMDFDLDLAIKQSSDNPVFYVQYAHARICSIIRNIGKEVKAENLELLNKKEEINLLKVISNFSDEILKASNDLDPSKITKYAMDLAGSFHSFYNAHRVIVDDEDLMNARLALVTATRNVLKNTLDILGVSALEKM
ncbi:arginine--tRNA ligase [Anaerofustis stercorihominis]|uniref:Arginine--tRNA ligase n=1 Tax=Anaerofustis stercorihominis TaxID=214853 RepID=A0A3E3DVW5_9FIRM|nr:arginine--tRNA ligase [Anaerofustis stercorihominis]RGD73427.1 arginine--tRNA ligase [Anaerofustis stercorihominis]